MLDSIIRKIHVHFLKMGSQNVLNVLYQLFWYIWLICLLLLVAETTEPWQDG